MNITNIFYKLLILFTLFLSFNVYADYWSFNGVRGGDPLKLCKDSGASWSGTPFITKPTIVTDNSNYDKYVDCYTAGYQSWGRIYHYIDDKCHHADTPATILYPYGSPKPLVGCEPVQGGFCMWQIEGDMVINLPGSNQHSVIHRSKGFVTSCTQKKEGVCDPKDPYGSCYTPPNDGCTRHKDGSIICPPEKPPEIKQGCENGATYCNQPKDGCGSNYVSGNFNGKPICVAKPNPNNTSNSSDKSVDNDGGGSSGSGSSGSGSSSGGSSGSGSSGSGSSGSGSSGSGSSGSGSSSGGSDGGFKDNGKDDKTNNDGDSDDGGCKDINNCNWVTSDDFKNVFQKPDEKQLDELSYQDNQGLQQDKSNFNNSLHDFSNKLTLNSGGQCIGDFTVNVFGKSITLPISEWCPVIALFKIFLHLVTFLICLRLIHATIIRL